MTQENADTTANLEVSLGPPAVPLPEVQQEINILEQTRERSEAEVAEHIQRAYVLALGDAKKRAGIIISRFAGLFDDKQIAKTSSISFLAARQGPAQEPRLSVIAHVIGAPPPDPTLKGDIDSMERQNLLREQERYNTAIGDFSGICDELLLELEVALRQKLDHDLAAGLTLLGKVNSVHLPQQANINVISASTTWPTIASLVGDMETRRGVVESMILLKIQQLQLQLVEELTDSVEQTLEKLKTL